MTTPNTMQDVDLSAAELRWVEFRLIDLQNLTPPKGPNHLLIRNFPRVLRRAVDELQNATTQGDRGLRGALEVDLRWVSPTTEYGILNRLDLGETDAEQNRAVELIRRLESRCSA